MSRSTITVIRKRFSRTSRRFRRDGSLVIMILVGWAKARWRRGHHLIAAGGHAEPVIGCAFARPAGFAHPTPLLTTRAPDLLKNPLTRSFESDKRRGPNFRM